MPVVVDLAGLSGFVLGFIDAVAAPRSWSVKGAEQKCDNEARSQTTEVGVLGSTLRREQGFSGMIIKKLLLGR